MTEPDRSPDLRVSDAERHEVAEVLQAAAGDGRIDLDELDERLGATHAARTYADLARLTSDLSTGPSTAPARVPSGAVAPTAKPQRHVAVMGGLERKGAWTVPAAMTVTCCMGGADLDLREARWTARETVLTVHAFMGGASIVVGPEVEVVMEGTGIMGGYAGPSDTMARAELTDDSPVLRVRGVAVWGGVSVERRPRGDDGTKRSPHRLH
ncbi:MAG: hypothetical protein JWN84_1539 [Nocardioides sp.]|nr:hypothetical protein [Nocardioides sp.]